MLASNESLTSLNSATAHRKSDRIKYFEAKIAELGVLLRQKDVSIETSNKEIDRLRSELLRANSRTGSLGGAKSDHTDEAPESVESRLDLGSMLSKAEANLAAVDRLSEEVIAQKDEQHRKAIQELECAKNNLVSLEEEVRTLRAQLAEKVAEIEDLSLQLTQLSKEMEAKNVALENAEELRLKLLDDQSVKTKALRELEAENDATEMKVKELTTELNQMKGALSRQKHEAVEALDRARVAQAEAEKANLQARNASVRASEREADLKDRVRLLEERLVILTEPDAGLFTEQMEDAKLTSGPIPSPDAPETASARCVTLLVERKLLETRLAETRKHLEEVKSNLGEKLADLESQITNLNDKIAGDSAKHASEKAEWESQRQKLDSEFSLARLIEASEEVVLFSTACGYYRCLCLFPPFRTTQLTEVRGKQAEADAALYRAELDRTARELAWEEQRREWELTHTSLKAEIAALQQTAQTECRTHAEVLQFSQELQSRISDLAKDIENGVKEADSLKREKEELKVTKLEQELRELSETNAYLRTEMDRLTKTQEHARETEVAQGIALKEELARTEAELLASTKRIDDAQKAANAAEVKCQQLQSERDVLHAKMAEMEKGFQSRLAELEAKREEVETVQTSAEVASLKESINELNEVILDRNKTIRLQKQKLSELKKALGQGLRPVTVSNLSLISTDEEAHNHQQPSFVSGTAGSVALGGPSAVDVTLPPLFATSRQVPPASPPAILPAMETTQSLDSHCASTVLSTSSPGAVLTTNSHYDTDPVNFEYMRHVLLKFFLSHDSEALQLVRAVATVLKLSRKDEFLIRQRLEERRSWFATPVISPESSGQFAKMVSH
ncbi:muscle myosin heavy chain, putative [Echinococcus granulosus]|uniref:Muscle myosin heavy chain, putative n=1 Tax=Echinococcus granulosus TaxID=6210 RepID=W6V9P2_ECHGR|nr:muscle myosin heavy chain, putative [Echinococcus granulosus]EUB63379.1 muscle myosin heavy chain, putative [Echinococcus granulosus]